MTTSLRSTANDVRTEMNFHYLDDVQPAQHRPSSLGSRSYSQEHQHQETRNGDKRETSKSGRCSCCSKQCLIGLGIGLAIGVLLVIIIAVPVGVINRYPLGTISSTPNWVGTFQMDNACDTITCCCFSNQIKLFQTNNNQIQIVGSVSGLCNGFPSTISLIQSMPTGFQMLLTSFGENIRLQLGQDNSYISFVNINYAYCSTSALRTSYNAGSMKSMNLGLIMLILLINIGIMV